MGSENSAFCLKSHEQFL